MFLDGGSIPDLEAAAIAAQCTKGADDMGYVGTYSMLFDPIRHRVRNFTEIGVHNGRSLHMWHKYFHSRAHIWGLDIAVQNRAREFVRSLGSEGSKRVTLLQGDSRDAAVIQRHRLQPGSMDVVIDDGDHIPRSNARTLLNFWPLVRPGGFYIIEDVVTGGNLHGHFMNRGFLPLQRSGFAWLAHNASTGSWPLSAVREIYAQHDVFLADTQVGARDFDVFRSGMEGWFMDRVNHNAHLLVIRKRHTPRTRPVAHHMCNDRPRKTGVCAPEK